MKNHAMKNKIWNGQVLAELICYLLFGGTILYLILSNRYLSYVTPKMKPYLYFTAAVMLIWTGVSLTGLFRLQRRKRTAHCLVLIIPVLLLLMPHSGMSASSLSGTANLMMSNAVSGVLGNGDETGGSSYGDPSSLPPGGNGSDTVPSPERDVSSSYDTSGEYSSDSSPSPGGNGSDPNLTLGDSGSHSVPPTGKASGASAGSTGKASGASAASTGKASGASAASTGKASGASAASTEKASGASAAPSGKASGSSPSSGGNALNSYKMSAGGQDHSASTAPAPSGKTGGSHTSGASDASAPKTDLPDVYMTTDPNTQPKQLHGYDAKNKTITVSSDEYYDWVNEFFNNFDQLKGFKVTITGAVYKDDPTLEKNQFVPVRLVMTCCVADLTPLGLVCTYDKVPQLKSDQWVTVTGTLYQGKYKGENEPRLMVTSIKAAKPIPDYIYPYS